MGALFDPYRVTVGSGIGSKVTQVACGLLHTVFLTSVGKVYGMGDNGRRQATGQDSQSYVSAPTLVRMPEVSGSNQIVRQIAAGANHSLCCTNERVFAWGINDRGQIGVGHSLTRSGIHEVRPLRSIPMVRPTLLSRFSPAALRWQL